MPYALVIAMQVAAAVHLFVTRRDMRWLFLIILVPGLGAIVYFIIEVLLPMGSNPTAQRAWRRAQKAIDPNRGLREGSLNYERSQNIESAAKLADELTKAGRHAEAVRICTEARTGIFVDDPKILLALANAQFGASDYAATIATLDHLRAQNPGFRSADGHLVYARAFEDSGATERALEEYAALAKYYPGAEARVRQALLHKKLGQTARATELFAAVLEDARLAPKHFRTSQREWIEIAQREKP